MHCVFKNGGLFLFRKKFKTFQNEGTKRSCEIREIDRHKSQIMQRFQPHANGGHGRHQSGQLFEENLRKIGRK